ncbi:MAG: glycosyltransferase family 4 protein [Candidatus Omnitrophota bacterium]
MKILLLTTHLNIGGISVYTVGAAKYLKKEGIEVIAASSGGELEDLLAESAVTHIKMGIKTKAEFGPALFKTIPALIRLIKKEKFDLIHAQTRVAQVAACMASKFTGVPFVSTCHGFFRYKKMSRQLFPCWGSKVIAISESVRKHLVEDFNLEETRVTMIHNGIELEKYQEAHDVKDNELKKKIGIGEKKRVIGAVGRLSGVKGFNYLVDAFEILSKKYTDIHLLIVGEGKEERSLAKRIKNAGLSDRVTIETNNIPLAGYLSLMDIFCLPSILEGLGLSLMEAMASGKACVASDIGGISELIIDGKDGILVPTRDPSSLAKGISRLLEDEVLRKTLGAKAREKAIENFSIVESTKKTIRVYEEVIRGRP